MFTRLSRTLIVAALLVGTGLAHAEPRRPECVAPSKPGGGFDMTCKLAQIGLKDQGMLKKPMRVVYMPGGIGAVAYNMVVAQKPSAGDMITVFSSGSLLNIAQGKFGQYDQHDVKWLAALGATYGAIVVRSDSPYQTLEDLLADLRKDPKGLAVGGNGTVGSQLWMQAALLMREAQVNPRELRYVGFDAMGDVFTALLGGHVQVISTDISVAANYVESGDVRVLAVLAEERMGDKLASIPTAKEQGYDVSWPMIRGVYTGPQVKPQDYDWWKSSFDALAKTDDFERLVRRSDLFPFYLAGDELSEYVDKEVERYRQLAAEFGLAE